MLARDNKVVKERFKALMADPVVTDTEQRQVWQDIPVFCQEDVQFVRIARVQANAREVELAEPFEQIRVAGILVAAPKRITLIRWPIATSNLSAHVQGAEKEGCCLLRDITDVVFRILVTEIC